MNTNTSEFIADLVKPINKAAPIVLDAMKILTAWYAFMLINMIAIEGGFVKDTTFAYMGRIIGTLYFIVLSAKIIWRLVNEVIVCQVKEIIEILKRMKGD